MVACGNLSDESKQKKIVLCDVYVNIHYVCSVYLLCLSVVNIKLKMLQVKNDLRVLNLFVQTFSYLLCFSDHHIPFSFRIIYMGYT